MAADLRFVANAAEAHPYELAAQRLGDRLAETRLPDARRSHEAKNRTFDVRFHFPYREKLENSVFDFLEVVVIGLEDILCFRNVVDVLGLFGPGNAHEPVEVGAADRVFGRSGRNLRQAVELS